MTKCKTVCVQCKYHCGVPATSSWSYHICCHPNLVRVCEQDPVTGLQLYASRNSLGQVMLTNDKHPYCRDVNHGNCEYYTSLD